ncbi:hypothetical protein HS088_TW08G00248 [Tripterygium wilfordii]|uniref:SAM domain-containing protein n=1 Tax=Tripterygium wilfordii TaxID=458696 RepID=A0A7J7DBE8_TRIWF|nr:uncharacterized protein LOC120004083 [Tripterygium wilfordii]KAF5743663.1 hypothetical protein HS088_TW08G00248 [Tripterygium wilfordii]
MADIQQPEAQLNGVGGAQLVTTTSEPVGSKRQRRPSVRLGEIGGDQPYDSHGRRSSAIIKQFKQHLPIDHRKDPKSSKTRPLTNLTEFQNETLDEDREVNLDTVAIGSWRVKDSKKRGSNATTKRVRSNWISRVADNGGGGNNVEGEEKYSGGEDMDEDGTYRDFDRENSESPLREQSPDLLNENLADARYRRPIRTRDHQDGVDFSGPSDTDDRNNNNNNGSHGEDGVKVWLNSLGLGRYAPVFEIHEVDDEVLPLLTLEDLKDMGINAVGSRRKMYCAIQKLGKGFS